MKAELPSVSQTDRTEEGSLPASTAARDVLHLCFAATATAAGSCPASCQATGQRLQNLPSKRKRCRDNLPQEDFGSKPRGTAGAKPGSSRRGNIREACLRPGKTERRNTAAAARPRRAHPRASPEPTRSSPPGASSHRDPQGPAEHGVPPAPLPHLSRAGEQMVWQATVHLPPHCDGLISQPGIRAAWHCLLLINFGGFPPSLKFAVVNESTHRYLNISVKSDG